MDLYVASTVFCIQSITVEGLFAVVFLIVTTSLYYFLGKVISGCTTWF
ncbi:hypothetical protein PR003_g3194 [Phytophthora rubi]|uniref:Uncharacterized protein n=1 Tax=Phytophthora rubi TaxID=129364 RepID=A0A6A4G4M4_9STRA|nr:hypothetical protein PR002_g24218 [Phytophthora rubi]KAE9049800.1 hypothetical protein PR001_g2971 [Phytophthora rubi]KAE9354789.1 hypothetical protein PR003_g3194 [Phytophthora rubi]